MGEGITWTAAFLKRLPSNFAVMVAASDDDGGHELTGTSSQTVASRTEKTTMRRSAR